MYESVHNHTVISDGTQTHLQLLSSGQQYGFGVMAFTDHDAVPSEDLMAQLHAYKGPVKWFIGCEVSSGLPKAQPVRKGASLHVLGVFVNPFDAKLVDHCRKAQSARAERVERIVSNLKQLGFVISVEAVMQAAGGESVGRPHIVRALNLVGSNAVVIEKIRMQMERAAIESPQIAMDYAIMRERPESDYPYRLFLSEDAFIPDVYVDYLYSIDMDEAVKLIRDAGGAAVLAHPYTASKYLDETAIEALLRDGRLDGVELMGNPINQQARKALPTLEHLAELTGALATYGVDAHRDEDIRNFVSDRKIAERTVGQTARLIERIKPDLTYSNLAS